MATNELAARHTSRRQVLKAGLTSPLLPFTPRLLAAETSPKPVTFGMIADLHHGLAPDAQQRLETVLAAAEQARCDAIIQLGDFNYADAASTECTRLWQQFGGPRYHVLGNHDMDRVNKAAVAQAWHMPGRCYRFDRGGVHFVVRDRNNLMTDDGYVPYAKANFYVSGAMRAFTRLPASLQRGIATWAFRNRTRASRGAATASVRRQMTRYNHCDMAASCRLQVAGWPEEVVPALLDPAGGRASEVRARAGFSRSVFLPRRCRREQVSLFCRATRA